MKRTRMPLYAILKSDIINRIVSGELRKGDKLPSERELVKRLGISRITVVGALRELANEGVITKSHGRGSFVAKESFEEDYENIFTHTSSGQETEITFGMFRPTPQYRLLIKTLANLFQLENPRIKVTPVDVFPPADMTNDIYLLRIGEGTAPSVGEFFMHADYAAINALAPLETLPGFQELAASLRPQCSHETIDANGEKHVHALALKGGTRVLLANINMLKDAGINPDTAPLNWSVLGEWVGKLSRRNAAKRPGHFAWFAGLPEGWHNVIGLLPYLWGDPARWEHSTDGFIKMLESKELRQGLKFLSKLHAAGGHAPVNGQDLFAVGQVGLILNSATWPLALSELMSDKFEIRAFPIPSPDGASPLVSVNGNFSVGIFNSAVRSDLEMDAAWRWIKFLFRSKQQFALTTDLTFPALRNLPSQLGKSHPDIEVVFRSAMDAGAPQFDFKNVRMALNAFGQEARRCLTGKTSPDKCAAATIDKIKAIA